MAEMTEEEYLALLALQQQAQMNPLALVANEWGQGPGFLGLEDRPDSWTRAGDKNQIMRDILGVTDIDFAEMVPGLYPNIQPPKPGDIDPVTQLYANDPAIQYVAELVAGGSSPVQAVNAIRSLEETDPELFKELSGSIPLSDRTDNYGGTTTSKDWEGFAKTATDYLAAAGNDQQALYDDYVRARTGYEKAVDSGKDVSYEGNRKAIADAMGYGNYERFTQPLQGFDDNPVGPVIERDPTRTMDQAFAAANDYVRQQNYLKDKKGIAGPADLQRNPMAGTRTTRGRGKATPTPTPRGEWAEPKATQRELNVRSSSDAADRILKSRKAESKKEENLARIIAAYNTYIYGQ